MFTARGGAHGVGAGRRRLDVRAEAGGGEGDRPRGEKRDRVLITAIEGAVQRGESLEGLSSRKSDYAQGAKLVDRTLGGGESRGMRRREWDAVATGRAGAAAAAGRAGAAVVTAAGAAGAPGGGVSAFGIVSSHFNADYWTQ